LLLAQVRLRTADSEKKEVELFRNKCGTRRPWNRKRKYPSAEKEGVLEADSGKKSPIDDQRPSGGENHSPNDQCVWREKDATSRLWTYGRTSDRKRRRSERKTNGGDYRGRDAARKGILLEVEECFQVRRRDPPNKLSLVAGGGGKKYFREEGASSKWGGIVCPRKAGGGEI